MIKLENFVRVMSDGRQLPYVTVLVKDDFSSEALKSLYENPGEFSKVLKKRKPESIFVSRITQEDSAFTLLFVSRITQEDSAFTLQLYRLMSLGMNSNLYSDELEDKVRLFCNRLRRMEKIFEERSTILNKEFDLQPGVKRLAWVEMTSDGQNRLRNLARQVTALDRALQTIEAKALN